jgi:quercetin dioxygenase-like cupin family protein
LTASQATQPIFFRERPRGLFSEWHCAPRRQYLIILSGEVEIGLGDGSKHRFGAGTALMVEDTTGQGHTTLIVDGEPVIQTVIPLVETE